MSQYWVIYNIQNYNNELTKTTNLFRLGGRTSYYGLRSIKTYGPKIWNCIRNNNSQKLFSKSLKTYLLTRYWEYGIYICMYNYFSSIINIFLMSVYILMPQFFSLFNKLQCIAYLVVFLCSLNVFLTCFIWCCFPFTQ